MCEPVETAPRSPASAAAAAERGEAEQARDGAGRRLCPAARAARKRLEEQKRLEAQRSAQEAEAARLAEAQRKEAEEKDEREDQARARKKEKKQARVQRKVEEARRQAQAEAAERRRQHLELMEAQRSRGPSGGGVARGEEDAGAEEGAKGAPSEDAGADSSTSCGTLGQTDGGDFLGYRAPVVSVMGHVDSGKTSLLDKIRRTNVQGKETRGITQQIGATFLPESTISEQARKVAQQFDLALPGMLVIDTPGHETFANLRSRGSSLCDIAVVVVNIKKGLEPQTMESLRLLRERRCPFVVALNQVDRLYGWEGTGFESVRAVLERQPQVADEFDRLLQARVLELNELGLNCGLHWDIERKDRGSTVSLVPTSAATGQGLPDLLYVLSSLAQDLAESLELKDELECVVLEVRAGDRNDLGATADVLLKNGCLREGDRIVLAGSGGPVVTTIKGILTPQPMTDTRARPKYTSHPSVSRSMCVKILATGLETVVAGTQLRIVSSEDSLEKLKLEAQAELQGVPAVFDRHDTGVLVKASELGKLEALLPMLRAKNIPVLDAAVGEVQQKDVKRAAVMREKRASEYAVIIAFDAQIASSAQDLAKREKVRIVSSKSIYELETALDALAESCRLAAQKEAAEDVVFPVVLKTLRSLQKSPMVLGCVVEAGQLRVGTPLCVQNEGRRLVVGRVANIQVDGSPVEVATRGDQVGVELQHAGEEERLKYGKGQPIFDGERLFSQISRRSVDVLKRHFSGEMLAEDWRVLEALRQLCGSLE